MKYLSVLGTACSGLLCALLIAGCSGMSGGALPPVVDRGVESEAAYPGQYPDQGADGVTVVPLPQSEPLPEAIRMEPYSATPIPAPEPESAPTPTYSEPRANPPAVVALLDHAEQQANAGDLDAASVTLERALRIDARNPILWHHLASIRLAEGEPVEAEQLATKSNSLAAGNNNLQAKNWQLIAQARRDQGDDSGAWSAEQQARVLLQRR